MTFHCALYFRLLPFALRPTGQSEVEGQSGQFQRHVGHFDGDGAARERHASHLPQRVDVAEITTHIGLRVSRPDRWPGHVPQPSRFPESLGRSPAGDARRSARR